MNFYLSMSFHQGFQVFFLPVLQEFNWSRATTSGAYSLRQLETGILAPVVGFLVDRWGPRTVILMGVMIAGLGMVALSFSNSLWSFYLAFGIVSVGASGASHAVSWVVAVANWFRRLRGRALGMAMLGPVVAGPLVVIVALLEGTLGWRHTVLILGIGLWVVGIPLAMVARTRPEDHGYHPDGELVAETETSGSGRQLPSRSEADEGLTTRQALATRHFWVLSFIFGVHTIAVGGLMVHLIPYLEGIRYSTAQAAGILGMVYLVSGIGRLGAGTLIDLLDRRLVLLGLFASQVTGLWVLSRMSQPSLWQVALFLMFYGIGFGGTVPLRPFLTRQFFGARSFGSIQGLVQGVAVGAGVLGPVYWGRVFDVTDSYTFAFYSTMAMVAAAAPLAFLLGPSVGQKKAPA